MDRFHFRLPHGLSEQSSLQNHGLPCGSIGFIKVFDAFGKVSTLKAVSHRTRTSRRHFFTVCRRVSFVSHETQDATSRILHFDFYGDIHTKKNWNVHLVEMLEIVSGRTTLRVEINVGLKMPSMWQCGGEGTGQEKLQSPRRFLPQTFPRSVFFLEEAVPCPVTFLTSQKSKLVLQAIHYSRFQRKNLGQNELKQQKN